MSAPEPPRAPIVVTCPGCGVAVAVLDAAIIHPTPTCATFDSHDALAFVRLCNLVEGARQRRERGDA